MQPLALCDNGVVDADNGETGVDCGGSVCDPCTVTVAYSSTDAAPDGTVNGNVVTFTATFSAPVTGVTVADFGLTTGSVTASTSLVATGGYPSTEWVLTVTLDSGLAASAVAIAAMGATQGAITPVTVAMAGGYVINYAPPVPTLTTASTNVNGAFTVTATFTTAVSGVVASDFPISSGSVAVDTSTPTPTGGAPATVWEMTVTPTSSLQSESITVGAMVEASGSISPVNAASNGLTIAYDPPTPVFSSTVSNGGNFPESTLVVTMTFDVAVTGVTEADFQLTSDSGTTFTTAMTGSGTTYELTVTITGDRAPTVFTFGSLAEAAGAISPPNEAMASNFVANYAPPTPVLTGSVSDGATQYSPTLTFTLDFGTDVSGVTEATFGLDTGSLSPSTSLSPTTGPAQTWTLTVNMVCSQGGGTVSVGPVAEAAAGITPANAASSGGYSIVYQRPVPVFSSSQGATGTRVGSDTLSFTATFPTAMTGVAASDFVVSAGGLDTSTSSVENVGGTGVVWAVDVTIGGSDRVETTVSVSMAAEVASPCNAAASNDGFNLVYVPPACEFDVCNIAAGIFADGCSEVNRLAGTYTCSCLSGRYGSDCTSPCPNGYTLLTNANGTDVCTGATSFTSWDNAATECAGNGGGLMIVESEAMNQFARQQCTGMLDASKDCWLGGSDQGAEGTWVWPDGGPVVWGFTPDLDNDAWLNANPDNSGGIQDCLLMLGGSNAGLWDDRDCSASSRGLCSTTYSLCANGLHDSDMDEDGTDCGGAYCPACPVHVSYSSTDAADDGTVNDNVITFTATFTYGVSNVTAADFGLSAGSLGVSSSVTPTGSTPATEWVLTVTINSNIAAGPVSVAAMADNQGSIAPAITAMTEGYTINYDPPVPTLTTASTNVNGAFTVTATFTTAVSGVVASDFPISSGSVAVDTSTPTPTGGAPATVWEMTVTPTSSLQSESITVGAMVEASGSISPVNAASNGLTIAYDPPTPVFSSTVSNGGNFPESTLVVTMTFDVAVTGVTEADFQLTSDSGTTFTTAMTGSGTTYELTVTITGDRAPTVFTFGSLAEAAGAISPPNEAMASNFVANYAPPTPVLTGSVSDGATQYSPTLTFTLDFGTDVSGVTEATFGLDTGSLSPSTSLSPTTGPAQTWTLTVNMVCSQGGGTVSVGPVAEAAAGITPANAASSGGYSIVYQRPVPVFSSSQGATGTRVGSDTLSFTATFPTAMTGVAASDFVVSAGGLDTSTSSVENVGGTGVVWAVDVTIGGSDRVETTVSVSMAAEVASPCNAAASNDGFNLVYVPPACEFDVCNMTFGFATACTDDDRLAGTYTCTCAAGRYGDQCLSPCPVGYTISAGDVDDVVCMGATSPATWSDAGTGCASNNGQLYKVESAAANTLARASCDALADSDTACWLGGSDVAAEAWWVWQDGSNVTWGFEGGIAGDAWLNANPDNNNNTQHCMLMLGGGDAPLWDDRDCDTNQVGLCKTDYTLCNNGVEDLDMGERGVDCGGPYCDLACSSTVMYTSDLGASGTTVNTRTITFTAVFGEIVTGVTEADFGLNVTGSVLYTTQLEEATGPNNNWVLTVELSNLGPATLSVAAMAANQGSIIPPTEAGFNSYTLQYVPPVPMLVLVDGTANTVHGEFRVDAVFSVEVCGVAASDFNMSIADPSLAATTSAQSHIALTGRRLPAIDCSTTWRLTVTPTANLVTTTFMFGKMAEASGAIEPANAESINAVVVTYDPPTSVLSSTTATNGGTVNAGPILVTATFDVAVAGVTAADFGMVADTSIGVSTSVTSSSGDTVWVLEVSIDSDLTATQFTFGAIAEASGTIAPPNEAGTGAYVINYAPPVPVISSDIANGATTYNNMFNISVDFGMPVSGFNASAVGVTGTLAMTAAMHTTDNQVFTAMVTVLPDGPSSGSVTVAAITELLAGLTPANAASQGGDYVINYIAPAPTFSSSQGSSGDRVGTEVLTFTATFPTEVSGLVTSDLVITSGGLDVDVSAVQGTTLADGPDTTWAFTVTVVGSFMQAPVTVSIPAGVVAPYNDDATNNGFSLVYMPPVCMGDPCDIAAGIFATDCSEVSRVDATYACTCMAGRYGDDCRSPCPVDFGLETSLEPLVCVAATTTSRDFATATGDCSAAGANATLFKVESAAANTRARQVCTAANDADTECWLGGSDIATEDVWVWQDGTSVVWGFEGGVAADNWLNVNPDNNGGDQDCMVLLGSPSTGLWDDRVCSSVRPSLCQVPYSLCHNGIVDVDMNETGVDCGGLCDLCPVTVSYSSQVARDGTTHDNVIQFTATFGAPVTGVAASDFGLTTGGVSATTSVDATGGAPSLEWVLTVTLNGNLQDAAVTVQPMAADSGSISPPTLPGDTAYTVNYEPPVPTFSVHGGSGVTVHGSFIVTATFTHAVAGVAEADFGMATGGVTVSTDGPSSVGPSPSTQWEVTVTPTSNLATAGIVFSTMAELSGSISPANAAGTNTIAVVYSPPTPVFSSVYGDGGTVSAGPFAITASFDVAVSGVTAADFGVSLNTGMAVDTAVSGGDHLWVLTITPQTGITDTVFTFAAMPEASNSISPHNGAMAAGYSLLFQPPTPVVTASVADGDSTPERTVTFTVDFGKTVSGVTADHFGLDVGGLVATSTVLSPTSGSAQTWTLAVTVQYAAGGGAISVGPIAEALTGVSPTNAASAGGAYTVTYTPPVPVFSSSQGTTGTRVGADALTFTATFPSPVSGVTAAAFGVNASGLDVTVSSASPAGGTAPDAVWTITVAVVDGTVESAVSVTMAGAVSVPPNDPASNNGFHLVFVPDACASDPCNLAAGIFADGCSEVDRLAGTYTCSCRDGRYGDACTLACPVGYTRVNTTSPHTCVGATPRQKWTLNSATCAANGGSLMKVESAEENTIARDMCDAAAGSDELCWLGASDALSEGTWIWEDGTAVVWAFTPDQANDAWMNINPDNNNNVQHCAALLGGSNYGEWDDRNCNNGGVGICNTAFKVCTNGLHDYDVGEEGTDCGGPCANACASDITVVYSSNTASSGSTIADNAMAFTATFTYPVAGVTVGDFGLDTGAVTATTSLRSQGPSPATVWVLDVTLSANLAPTTVSVAAMAAAQGGITPNRTVAMTDGYSIEYNPPVPTLSVAGGTPLASNGPTFQVTASFSSGVCGVTPSDFNIDAAGVSYDATAAPLDVDRRRLVGVGCVTATEWVLTVTPTANLGTATFTFGAIAEASGAISPANTASANTVAVDYDPPTPVLSSTTATNGGTVNAGPILVTATFDVAVAGVTAADFGMVADTSIGVSTSVTSSSGDTVWVLEVSIDSDLTATQFTFGAIAEASGTIAPPNEAGTGAYVINYAPPVPVISSDIANGATTYNNMFNISVDFGMPVSGFNASAVGVTGTLAMTAAMHTTDNQVFTAMVTVLPDGPSSGSVTVAAITELLAGLTPANAASQGGDYVINYIAPAPTFTSSSGVAGDRVGADTFSFTATFPTAVAMVDVADFGLDAGPLDVTTSLAAAGGAAPDAVWVLTVTVTGSQVDTTVSVAMPAGVVEPRNAAGTNNGFYLDYVAPPCVSDPCGLASGLYANSCADTDRLAGIYTCDCKYGRYGPTCRSPCPTDFSLAGSLEPPMCVTATPDTAWTDVNATCAGLGASFVSVHDADTNTVMRDTCTSQRGATRQCWLGASDGDAEGTWAWQDGSAFDYSAAWVAGAPGDAGDCLLMQVAGSWVDADCTETHPAMCQLPYLLCNNNVVDTDMGETGIDCGGICAPCPVTVAFSSAEANNGDTVNGNVMTVTATFGSMVSLVSASDFSVTSGSVTHTKSVAAVGSAPALAWVLTITLTENLSATPVVVAAMTPNSGSITPPNLAGDNGYTFNYVPPVPTYSTAATTVNTAFDVTATFTVAVSGVLPSDFNVATGGVTATTAVVPTGGAPATEWVLTVTPTANIASSTFTFGTMTELSGAITPATAAGTNQLSVAYDPPTPVYSSNGLTSGDAVASSTITITATFDQAVTGVTPAAFNGVYGGLAVTESVSPASGASATVWVLTVTVTGNRAAGNVVFGAMDEATAGVSPVNEGGSGGFTLSYTPPVVVYSSVTGNVAATNVFAITATFNVPVTGLQESDFGLVTTGDPTYTTALTTPSADVHVLTITVTSVDATTYTFTAAQMVEGQGSITPLTALGSPDYTITYTVPHPEFTSANGPSGTRVAGDTLTFFVDFGVTTPVSGFTESDLTLDAGGLAHTVAVTQAGGGSGADSEWVVTVTITGNRADTTVSISMGASLVSPPNAASNTYSLEFVAPLCLADPCNIAAGSFTESCEEVDTLAGEFTCHCHPGRYGATCTLPCPVGYTVLTGVVPLTCGSATDPTVWDDAQAKCATQGANFASVHSLAENTALRAACTLQRGVDALCWLAGNDKAVEDTFVWADNSTWNYDNWFGINPDNFDNNQDCLIMLPSGMWDDRNCVHMFNAMCALPNDLCGNGRWDADQGELATDCGGPFCGPCPVNVSFTSATPTTTHSNVITVTASFGSPVSGVQAADFNVSATGGVTLTTAVVPVGAAPSTQWVLTITVTGGVAASTITVPPLAGSVGAIVPANEPGDNGYTFNYVPPVPTYSTAATTVNTAFDVTATFTVAVSGVLPSDFNVATGGVTATTAVVPTGGAPATEWVLTVTPTANIASSTFTFGTMTELSGAITPATAAGTNQLSVAYDPPTPVYSSNGLTSGDAVASSTITITATFDQAVTGVTPAAFNGVYGGLAVTESVSPASGASATVWVLTVTVTGNRAAGNVVFGAMNEATAGVSPVNEAGAGGFTIAYAPPSIVSYSSTLGAANAVVTTNVLPITATFSTAVSGVVAADFGLTVDTLTSTVAVAAATSTPSTTWVLTVTVTQQTEGTFPVTVAAMADGQGAITPRIAAGPALPFTLRYRPPVPVITSSLGAANTRVAGALTFTATFTAAVSGVSSNDFTVSGAGDLQYNRAVASGTGSSPSLTWVFTLTPTGNVADRTITVSMAAGVTTPLNTAAAGFTLRYVAPLCSTDPCGIAEGLYSSACADVDTLAGTFSCTCLPGRYGDTCRDPCPAGYTLGSSQPLRCNKVTDPVSFDNAATACDPGTVSSVSSATQNAELRTLCDTKNPAAECWLGGHDLGTEGTFVWSDGSSFGGYTNWLGVNPDDAGGVQDCIAMRADGQWDDRNCAVTYPALCAKDYTLCNNNLVDADQGELGVDCGGVCAPCQPAFSSSLGVSGTQVNAPTLSFTLTFPTPVTGVTAADFHLNAGSTLGVSTSLAAVGGQVSAKAWVLTVAISPPLTQQTVTVSLPADSGAISPANLDASNNGFHLQFMPVSTSVSSRLTLEEGQSVAYFTYTFSQAVSGLDVGDFTIGAGNMTYATSLHNVTGTNAVLRVVLTDKLHSATVTATLVDDAVVPRNEAATGAVAFTPPIGTAQQEGVDNGGDTGKTTTGVIVLDLVFGEPVSGVTNGNLRVDSAANVTCAVSPVGAEPTANWKLACAVTPATAETTAEVYLDNPTGIVPPPAQRSEPLFTATFEQEGAGQEDPGALDATPEARSSFKWWIILLILAAIIAIIIAAALVAANKTGRVQHVPKTGGAVPTGPSPAPHSMA